MEKKRKRTNNKDFFKFFSKMEANSVISNFSYSIVSLEGWGSAVLTWTIFHKNKSIIIESDKKWNINISKLACYLGQSWQRWVDENESIHLQHDPRFGHERFRHGNFGYCWVSWESAIKVLQTWDLSLANKLCAIYEQYKFKDIKPKKIWKSFSFVNKGPCLYCFTINGVNKVGFSKNVEARIRSGHISTVWKLTLNWVVFIDQALFVEDAIKGAFSHCRVGCEHYATSSVTLLLFIRDYCALMEFDNSEVPTDDLKKFNESLNK